MLVHTLIKGCYFGYGAETDVDGDGFHNSRFERELVGLHIVKKWWLNANVEEKKKKKSKPIKAAFVNGLQK